MSDLELLRLELAFAKASEAGAHRMEQFHSDYAELWQKIAHAYREALPEGRTLQPQVAERIQLFIEAFRDKHL